MFGGRAAYREPLINSRHDPVQPWDSRPQLTRVFDDSKFLKFQNDTITRGEWVEGERRGARRREGKRGVEGDRPGGGGHCDCEHLLTLLTCKAQTGGPGSPHFRPRFLALRKADNAWRLPILVAGYRFPPTSNIPFPTHLTVSSGRRLESSVLRFEWKMVQPYLRLSQTQEAGSPGLCGEGRPGCSNQRGPGRVFPVAR